MSAWCNPHWTAVRETFTGPIPLNGIMVTTEVASLWLARKAAALGSVMPGPRDTHAINQMMANDSPLCCWIGDDALEEIKARCVLPEKYRGMPPNVGHPMHMMEASR